MNFKFWGKYPRFLNLLPQKKIPAALEGEAAGI